MLGHPIHPPRRFTRRTVLGLTLTAALTTVSGCGSPAGSDKPSAAGTPEKPQINVSGRTGADLAPFYLAKEAGYFTQEGLEVKFTTTPSTQTAMQNMISGQIDIVAGSYAAFFVAQSNGEANFTFVADGSSASPRNNMIVTRPGSAVHNVRDLAGKKIAVPAINGTSDSMAKAIMKANSVDYTKTRSVEVPFTNMTTALSRGDVDAAFMLEPFVTQAAKSIGAVPVIDAAAGPTADFPIGGYCAQSKFVAENPKTVAAFQRAMKRATDEVTANPSKIQPVVVKFAEVDQDTAELMTLPNYHTTLDARRIQRVPDLLKEFGIISNPIDARTMLTPQPDR